MSDNEKKSNILGGLSWVFAERITAQLVSTLVGIILARLLVPQDYGAVSIVMVFITLCNVFVTSGFGTAIVQKKEVDETDYNTAFLLSFIMASVLYGVLFFASPYIAEFYEMPILKPVIRVLGLRLILTSLNTVQQAHIQREMRFKKFFIATLFGTIISCAVGVVLAYCGYGVWALVAQYLTNTTIDSVVLVFVGGWNPSFKFSKRKAKEIYSFGIKVLFTELAFTISDDVKSLIVGKVFGSADLAYYDQGRKYPGLLVNNVNSSITKVLLPALSREQDDLYALKQIMRKSIRVGLYLLCPLLIGFAAISEDFVLVVLTEKWVEVVPYIVIFCFVYLTRPAESICHQALLAIGRSGLVFWIMVAIEGSKIVGILVSVFILKSVLWIALSSLLSTVISLLCFLISTKIIIGYNFKEQVADIFPSICISLIMGGIVYSFNYISFNVYIKLALQVLVGIAVYILLSIISKNDSWKFVVNFIRTKFNKNAKNKEIDYK